MYYHLYVMIDIFSLCAVHFKVHATELGELAKDFMSEAVRLNGGTAPLAIHADRGTSMTSKPVSALLSDLAILKSHSRPKVSNDNPYSEAQFKTLKYCPAFPGTFGSLQDARAFCGVFFTYYNHKHRHSGIGLHTPCSVHTGTAAAIQEQRRAVLNAACAANPRRFTRRPRAPRMPGTAWINKPVTNSDITQCPVTSKIPRRASLTCEEESVLSIFGRQRVRLPVSSAAERPLVTTKFACQGASATASAGSQAA